MGKIYEISIENYNDSYDAAFGKCDFQIFLFSSFTRVNCQRKINRLIHLGRSEIRIVNNDENVEKVLY